MREDIVPGFHDKFDEYPFCIRLSGISYCDATYRIKRCCAPTYILEYVIEGKGTVINEGVTFYPKAGDVYLLHRGSNHEYYSDSMEPWTKIWFNISGSLVEALFTFYKLNKVTHIQGLDLSSLFFEMLEISKLKLDDRKEMLDLASLKFHEILIRISDKLKSSDTDVPLTLPQKIKKYIDKNIEELVTLEQLSTAFFISARQIMRVFKKDFGQTPYDYILSERIEISKSLLVYTKMPISDIAKKLRFSNQSHFCKTFKERAGQSPATYRKLTYI